MTLLEYGHSIETSTFSNNIIRQVSERKAKSSDILSPQTSNNVNNLAELLQDLSEVGSENLLSSNKLGNIVSLHVDSISQFSQIYQSFKEDQPKIVSQTNLRLIASLEKQYLIQKESLNSLKSIYWDTKGVLDSERISLNNSFLEGSKLMCSLEELHVIESKIEVALFERYTELLIHFYTCIQYYSRNRVSLSN